MASRLPKSSLVALSVTVAVTAMALGGSADADQLGQGPTPGPRSWATYDSDLLAVDAGATQAPVSSVVLPSGVRVIDTVVGNGVEATVGSYVIVNYTGWLYGDGRRGKKFDSSLDRGEPLAFPIGAGAVIQGLEEGVAGMKIGGKRTLIIPSSAGYGERGAGADVPPGAMLIFDIELLQVE